MFCENCRGWVSNEKAVIITKLDKNSERKKVDQGLLPVFQL